MDHEEPVLDLSDVVHDHTIDDDDATTNSDNNDQTQDSTPNAILSPLQKSNSHLPTSEPFSVEVLEREIATLLNQNASAASAALLSAAAQQHQASLGQTRDGEADGGNDNLNSLASIDLSGLAAVLNAAHAQAAENERVAQELAAKDPEFARQRAAALAEKGQKNTRTAPAFHSLTAGESSEGPHKSSGLGERGSQPPDTDYLYSDGHSDSDADGPSHPIPPSRPDNDPPTSLPGEFTDINDILTQLSGQYDPELEHRNTHGPSSPDPSPVVSHARPTTESQRHPPTPPPVLTQVNRTVVSQPVASTSAVTLSNGSNKKGKKTEKEKGPNHMYPCDHENCNKSFTRRSDLARHTRIHTGERPFVCDYTNCGKTFIQRSALHVHSRVHTGEKPHCCEYPACGKTFSDSSSLARHRRTHTGKRPYKCEDPNCEKTFTRRTTLNQHMRTHDPNWTPDPNVKYNFKSKRRRVEDSSDDDQALAESVRTISALFHAGGAALAAPPPQTGPEEALEVRVASISAEIAAAIAQAQSRGYEEEEEEEDELEDDSGDELERRDTIGPNTSGIRGLGEGEDRTALEDSTDREDDDSDAFPAPLRTRRGKDTVATGEKRKR